VWEWLARTDTNELQRACLEENADMRKFLMAGSFSIIPGWFEVIAYD
jgi:hypothetical protein